MYTTKFTARYYTYTPFRGERSHIENVLNEHKITNADPLYNEAVDYLERLYIRVKEMPHSFIGKIGAIDYMNEVILNYAIQNGAIKPNFKQVIKNKLKNTYNKINKK